MTGLKDQMLKIIAANSTARMADLTGEFVRAKPEEKEAIIAGIDFEGELATICHECLTRPEKC